MQLKFRAFEHGGKKLKNTGSIFSSTMCPFYQNMLVVRCCEVLTSHCQAWGMRPKMLDEVMPKAGWYCFEPGRQNAANAWSIFQNGAIMICTCVVNSDAATVGTMEIKDHKQNHWSIYSIISIILFKSMQYEAMCNDMQPLSIFTHFIYRNLWHPRSVTGPQAWDIGSTRHRRSSAPQVSPHLSCNPWILSQQKWSRRMYLYVFIE